MSDATRSLDTPEELITELFRRVRDLEARELGKFAATRYRGVASGVTNTTIFSFTNTSFLDLDAVTGGTTGTAVIVTLEMPYAGLAQVTLSARLSHASAGGICVLGYRVSGATTKAGTDTDALSYHAGTAGAASQRSWVAYPALNAGSNVIEMVARSSGGSASLQRVQLAAAPWSYD